MSRLILLAIFAVWLIGSSAPVAAVWPPAVGLAVFFGGYAAIVIGMGIWGRALARRIDSRSLHGGLRRFNRMLNIARSLVPAWLGMGVFGPVGWSKLVVDLLGPLTSLNVSDKGPGRLALLPLLLGTLPALLAWMGLWWGQFPADRALREQSLLDQLDHGLPIHAPPSFRHYFWANFRQQLLFTVLPILLIVVLRDLAFLSLRLLHLKVGSVADFENWTMIPSAAVVFMVAPELLRRVLHTQPLPDSPLRQRLEAICRRVGLRYRQILLWHTEYSMGNAAVMGLIPRLRYILLSDLLLETLSDQQIEAVFAHEAGHIKHRHMVWFAVFFIILTLGALGPLACANDWVNHQIQGTALAAKLGIGTELPDDAAPATLMQRADVIVSGLGLAAATFAMFGYLSRRFERQADVFAARMMESDWGLGGTSPSGSHVGEHGAGIVASALDRVAVINNIPAAARSWCHGSIAKRMDYLRHLSGDPSRTSTFDRLMGRLYATLVLTLVVFGAVALAVVRSDKDKPTDPATPPGPAVVQTR